MLRSIVVEQMGGNEPWLPQWDSLAVDSGKPYCAPACLLSWWRSVASTRARLRIMLVLDEKDDLAGIAPLYFSADPWGFKHYRLLGAGTFPRVEPLSRPGERLETASAIATGLASLDPQAHCLGLEWTPTGSPWATLLAQYWPRNRKPTTLRKMQMVAPTLGLRDASFQDWLKSRSRNFRQQTARHRRRLLGAGAVVRLAEREEELEEGIDSLFRLHQARWQPRGGSSAIKPGVKLALVAAGRQLVPTRRVRLWSIEAGGRTISSHLFFAAGGELSYLMGGFDVGWATYQPSIHILLEAIEHAWAIGDDRIDFGPGADHYKYRFADDQDELEFVDIVPWGWRYPATRCQLIPHQLRRGLARRLPAETKWKLKRATSNLSLLRSNGEAGH